MYDLRTRVCAAIDSAITGYKPGIIVGRSVMVPAKYDVRLDDGTVLKDLVAAFSAAGVPHLTTPEIAKLIQDDKFADCRGCEQ
jgi:hypothetical protein